MSFPLLVSKMRVIAVTLDSTAHLTYCNEYFEKLTGWKASELIGCDWFERFIPPDVEDVRGVVAGMLHDLPDAWHHENEILRKSGERVLVCWNNAAIRDATGSIIGIASIGEDITEQRKLERELLDSAARERQHLAAELHDGLGQMVYGASLMVDSLRIKSIKGEVTAADYDELAETMNSSLKTCHQIAQGLSPLANVRGSLVEALHALTSMGADSKPLVKLEIIDHAPLRLDATSLDHLYRLAQQALTNSLKHAFADTILVNLEIFPSLVVLSISDDGVGMSPDALLSQRLGLKMMRYRSHVIHAKLMITPVSPHGTCVTIECPQAASV